jgi:putative transposase
VVSFNSQAREMVKQGYTATLVAATLALAGRAFTTGRSARAPNEIWQSDMTKIWAGPAVGWAYLVCVIDGCTREIVGWNLSNRCRTEDALAAVEQAVLERLPRAVARHA